MKFQKTLLAAALAVVGLSAQAAVEVKDGLANAFKYSNGTNQLLKVNVLEGEQSLIKTGWFEIQETIGADGKIIYSLERFEGDTSSYTKLVSGGQVNITTKEDSDSSTKTTVIVGGDTGTNVDQNNYWSYEDKTTTIVTTIGETKSEYEVIGQLVNYDENGNQTPEHAVVEFGGKEVVTKEPVTTETKSTIKKDVQIGNLTEEQTTANAEYDFDLKTSSSNVQGLVATIKTSDKPNTAVAGVTGNGLAVLDVPKGGLVDLEKGTVTFITDPAAEIKTPRTELLSYRTADGKNVVQYGGNYYTLDVAAKSLTTYTGSTDTLTLIGAGTAEEMTGGERTVSVNTGLVSNKNVTYGESVTKSTNEGRVQVGSTDPDQANSISGTDYIVNQSTQTVTSKNVVTGIIAEDASGNKTYGLQTTTVVDNKVTGQTTVTAEGITTTGDVTIFAGSDKETTVGTFVEKATKDVDAKVGVALANVAKETAGLTGQVEQLNGRVAQLNKRVNDVEEVANRGVAIALAAQQQIPNIAAGQVAVFGGVGHYEGESAAALGLATVFGDGRTSLSAAIGVAGGSEVGGRVGVAYVFGGK